MSCKNCKYIRCTELTKLQKMFFNFGYSLYSGKSRGFKYLTYSINGRGSVIYANTVEELFKHIEVDRKW